MNNNTDRLQIGFMGVPGSFSEKASKNFSEKNNFQEDYNLSYFPLVDAFRVRDALLRKEIQMGVVAIKNSTTGMVAETEEAFRDLHVEELDEFVLPIH